MKGVSRRLSSGGFQEIRYKRFTTARIAVYRGEQLAHAGYERYLRPLAGAKRRS
jgi:hypothetical protein